MRYNVYYATCIIILFFIGTHSYAELNLQPYTHWHNFIRHLLNQYRRPVTILEVGAAKECISFDIVHHYRNVTCVMIDWDTAADRLLNACEQQNSDNIILLGKSLSASELSHLSECEHFDIVIVNDTMERFKPHTTAAYGALLNMGDYIIFKDIPALNNSRTNPLIYGLGCCYVAMMRKTNLQRTAWVKARCKKNTFAIKSNFDEKLLYKGWKIIGTPWLRGINLYSYRSTNALYPSFDYVYNYIKQFRGTTHNDIWLGNMVIQGKKIRLIDFDDKRRRADPELHLQRCLFEFEEAIRHMAKR